MNSFEEIYGKQVKLIRDKLAEKLYKKKSIDVGGLHSPGRTSLSHAKSHFAILFPSQMINTTVKSQPLQTVSFVDLQRYAGKWYEIASYPQRFQKGCYCTTAEYTPTEKNYLIVENRCNRGCVHGKQSYIKGKAFVEKNSGNSKLRVQFFWPFKGKYWIIYLASDYSYAIVSHPTRKYLWILSRTPEMDKDTCQKIISWLKENEFDTGKLQFTQQI